jgi:hypothetical protein
MKFENFDKCREIVEQIEKLQSTYNELNSDCVAVNFTNKYGGSIMKIDTLHASEHDHTKNAINFLSDIKIDILDKITALKAELYSL